MRRETLEQLSRRYDLARVPGYLSYPVMSSWTHSISSAQVLALAERAVEPTHENGCYIYVHFPYCQTLCYYCACFMAVTLKPKPKYDVYLDALERELALKFQRSGGRTCRVGEMHWGGGTPTYMDGEQLRRAFRAVEGWVEWTPGAILSIEAYPDETMLSAEKMKLLAALGFNQISFGIETFDPVVMDAINRQHSLDAARRQVDRARSLGLGVHIDLVYGLPHQTEESLADSAAKVASLEPSRIAAFPFMYDPLRLKHQRVFPPESVPDSITRACQHATLDAVLLGAGYTRVGVDHYVKGEADPLFRATREKDLIYHFQGYEPQSRASYLGFGSCAVSFIDGHYFQNRMKVNDYLASLSEEQLPIIDSAAAVLSADDKIRHRVIMKNLLCDLEIDKERFLKESGIGFDQYFADELPELRQMEQDGLLRGVGGQVISVTEVGRLFIRNIANVFDQYDRRQRRA